MKINRVSEIDDNNHRVLITLRTFYNISYFLCTHFSLQQFSCIKLNVYRGFSDDVTNMAADCLGGKRAPEYPQIARESGVRGRARRS